MTTLLDLSLDSNNAKTTVMYLKIIVTKIKQQTDKQAKK